MTDFRPDDDLAAKAMGGRAAILRFTTAAILTHPDSQRLTEDAREHFGIADPVTRRDAAWNRKHAPRPELCEYLDAKLAHLAEHCSDEDMLALLQIAFHPDMLLALPDPPPEEAIPLPPQMDAMLAHAFRNSGFPDAYRQLFVNLFADRVTDGDLIPFRPFTTAMGHAVFEFPTGDDVMVCLVATRATDVKFALKEFRQRWRNRFVIGNRDRQPHDPERDFWMVWQYFTIRDDDSFTDQTLYDELLNRFLESPYAADLSRYDLDSADGQRKAKGWLRQIVYRQAADFRKIIEHIEAHQNSEA